MIFTPGQQVVWLKLANPGASMHLVDSRTDAVINARVIRQEPTNVIIQVCPTYGSGHNSRGGTILILRCCCVG